MTTERKTLKTLDHELAGMAEALERLQDCKKDGNLSGLPLRSVDQFDQAVEALRRCINEVQDCMDGIRLATKQ